MKTLIELADDNEWLVWAGLDGEDPRRSAFGFVVGEGPTRAIAVDRAVKALADALRDVSAQTYKENPACAFCGRVLASDWTLVDGEGRVVCKDHATPEVDA